MKIAVTSQDRLTITGHAGHCQRFWVYEVEGTTVLGRSLLELEKDQTFHSTHHEPDSKLDGIKALISMSMGQGLVNRLEELGVAGVVTPETDPDKAVAAWLDGSLKRGVPHAPHGRH